MPADDIMEVIINATQADSFLGVWVGTLIFVPHQTGFHRYTSNNPKNMIWYLFFEYNKKCQSQM